MKPRFILTDSEPEPEPEPDLAPEPDFRGYCGTAPDGCECSEPGNYGP